MISVACIGLYLQFLSTKDIQQLRQDFPTDSDASQAETSPPVQQTVLSWPISAICNNESRCDNLVVCTGENFVQLSGTQVETNCMSDQRICIGAPFPNRLPNHNKAEVPFLARSLCYSCLARFDEAGSLSARSFM